MLFGALFAMHSHVFGEVMDIAPDRLSGRRSTATMIGVIPSKLVIFVMLAAEALLIHTYFHDFWISAALVGAVWFLLDVTVLWRDRPYSLAQMRVFLLGWNAIALASMGWVWSTASLTHNIHP